MNILIAGAAGFIGTNLALALIADPANTVTLADAKLEYFTCPLLQENPNVHLKQMDVKNNDFDLLVAQQDIVFHLVSTTNPSSSNNHIEAELDDNIAFSTRLLEACVAQDVKKIIFISSGGTVYGNTVCPINEDASTNPISAYGIQKLTIEKIFQLYHYLHGIDYNIIRLANPYGPYQRPNGKLGALTTFTYKAIHNEPIHVYGDGSVGRDYIYIGDAVDAIIKISLGSPQHHLYNVGSGMGTSINDLLQLLRDTLDVDVPVVYEDKRSVDLAQNYLDIHRYENEYGPLVSTTLSEGIRKTADFLRSHSY